MATCSPLLVFLLVWTLDSSAAGVAKEFQAKETQVYAEEGCGPNRYALFCRNSDYDLTVANPNTEYVSSVKMKRLYDFLSHSKCYRHLKSFLCGALFPMCSEDPFEIIFPCRDICEIAERNCQPVLEKYGEAWPEELNCTRFYDTNCLGNEGPAYEATGRKPPQVKQTEHGRKKNQAKGTVAGRKTNKKHGHRKGMQQTRQTQYEPDERHDERHDDNYEEQHGEHHDDGQEESQREINNRRTHVNKIKDMKPFWKLFKKTLEDVSHSLNALSDTL